MCTKFLFKSYWNVYIKIFDINQSQETVPYMEIITTTFLQQRNADRRRIWRMQSRCNTWLDTRQKREHGIFVWETCLRYGSPIPRETDVHVISCRVPVFHSRTNARSEIRRMLMRRPVSCSDPARGIILSWKLNSGIPMIHGTTHGEPSKKALLPISVALWKSSRLSETFRFLCWILQLYDAIITVCKRPR